MDLSAEGGVINILLKEREKGGIELSFFLSERCFSDRNILSVIFLFAIPPFHVSVWTSVRKASIISVCIIHFFS